MQGQVLKIPKLKEIAKKYGKSPVQIVLRWDLQKGVVTIPRSGKPNEIISNAQIFDFELSEVDVALIDSLNRNKKIFPYYDKIPFLLKYLINNKRKLPVVTELIKATAFKTKNRTQLFFTGKIKPAYQKEKVVVGKNIKL